MVSFLVVDFCKFLGGGKHKTKIDKNLKKIHYGFDVSKIAINLNGEPSSKNRQDEKWKNHLSELKEDEPKSVLFDLR